MEGNEKKEQKNNKKEKGKEAGEGYGKEKVEKGIFEGK